jgi:uncharacterized protein
MNSVTQVTSRDQSNRIAPAVGRTPFFKRAIDTVWEIAREKDPPHKIALGLALGIFIGFLPIMGIQMAVVTLLALIIRGNLKAALAGVWISNPITFVPLYWANYLFGTLFFPERSVGLKEFGSQITHVGSFDVNALRASLASILNMGAEIFLPLWVGSIVLGLVFGVLIYLGTYHWVRYYRRRTAESDN